MNLKAKKVIKKLVDDFDSGTIDHAIYTELIKGAMSFYKLSAEEVDQLIDQAKEGGNNDKL